MHSKHSINSSIKTILKVNMTKSSTQKLLEGRPWGKPDVNQTCSITDICGQIQDRAAGSKDPYLTLFQQPSIAVPFYLRHHNYGNRLWNQTGPGLNAGITILLATYSLWVSFDSSISWGQEGLFYRVNASSV